MIGIGQTSGKGRGVFAWSKILAGTLIEEMPVVVVPATQIEDLHRTVLRDYYFKWGPDRNEAALLLGTFSLCNHSYEPNAVYVPIPERMTIAVFARRDITPGEEITINYHGDPESQNPVDFPVIH
jgi:SET domain-containing protein